MGSKYDIRGALQNDQKIDDIAFLNKLGAQQAAQTFIDSYMSPTQLSDLTNRLGTVISTASTDTTVSDYTFPPFNLDVTRSDLGIRAGGFKQLNDKINATQLVYRALTGEIRTKITEWDLSLYLQELWLDDLSLFDLSLIYRLFVDNPSGYTDTRALVYGILNTAMNFEYKDTAYNPVADPDLVYWVAPTEDLLASQNYQPSKGHYVTSSYGGWNIFGWKIFQNHTSTWVWDVPPSPAMNDWQKEQVRLATAAGWTTWNPPYWQLFFNSDNPATIGPDDFTAIIAHLSDLMKKRHSKAPVPATKPAVGSSTLLADGAGTSQLGMNLSSLIWYGLPYGRYADPRSISGYLGNRDTSTPKIDTSSSVTSAINTAYSFGNPTDGISKILNGWASSYDVTTYIQTQQEVFHPNTSHRSRHYDDEGENDGESYKTITTITTPTTTTTTDVLSSANMKPLASGLATLASSTKRIIQQKTYGYLGAETASTHTAQGRGSGRGDSGGDGDDNTGPDPTPTETWGYTEVEQEIDPQTTIQIANFENFTDIDTVLGGAYIGKPVILTGSPLTPTGAPPFVVIGTLQKVQTSVESSRRTTFLWWSWTTTVVTKTWVYQLDMSPGKGQGFSINTGSNDVLVSNPHLPMQLFKNGAYFTGVFFGIPARTLTAASNVITDGWDATAAQMTAAQGQAIATALLNPMWFNGEAFLRAPLHRVFDSLLKVLTPVADVLTTLHALFSPSSGDVIANIVGALRTDAQAKTEIQSALTTFGAESRGALLTKVEAAQTAYSTLITALNNMIATRGTYLQGDLSSFQTQYPLVMGALTDSTLVAAIQSYMNILYEQRIDNLSLRINKESGTLINVARTEFALAMMQDSLAAQPKASDLLVQSRLKVRHQVTNISLMERAATAAADLPVEKTKIVYVKVDYTSAGDVIIPPAGEYTLFSQEVTNDPTITAASWYITFEGEFAPNILKNVITTLDGQKLQQIMTDTNLTDLEKVCYARTLEDWWEIIIPESSRPLDKFYQTGLQLILIYQDDYIDQYLQITGVSTATNPVADSTTRLEIGAVANAPVVQDTLAEVQGTATT